MATLGTLRTRIADELQIDASTFATEIDRAIFSAVAFYNDEDFWFLETSPAMVTLSSTTQYALLTVLPDRSQIFTLSLHINQSKSEMHFRTLEEMLDLEYDTDFAGEPLYWSIFNDQLMILPRPNRTYTAEVHYSLRRSMTASASASSVWTNEAEELIRLHAMADLMENRIKDFQGAVQTKARLKLEVLPNLHKKTVARKRSSRIKPFM